MNKPPKGITLRNGCWQVRTSHKGQPIYRLFPTGTNTDLTNAKKYLLEEKRRVDMGQHYKEQKTLEEVYLFMDEEKRGTGHKKEQSSKVTDYYFYSHIAPLLDKDRPIHSFTEYEILDFQHDILNSDLEKSTQAKIIGLLKQIFRTALKHRWIVFDYTLLIDRPKVTKGKIKIFTKEQQELLYAEAEREFKHNPNVLGMIVLGIYGGLRLAEMRGIRWKDIDFENHAIHITEQFHTSLRKYTETKTEESVRTLGMIPPVEAMLKRIYDRASKQTAFKETDSVLTSWHKGYSGKPLNYHCFYDMLGRLTVRCGLPKESRIHVLRKTCDTNMINDYGITDACAWLGHSKASTTWSVYTNKDSVRENTYSKMLQDYEAKKGA